MATHRISFSLFAKQPKISHRLYSLQSGLWNLFCFDDHDTAGATLMDTWPSYSGVCPSHTNTSNIFHHDIAIWEKNVDNMDSTSLDILIFPEAPSATIMSFPDGNGACTTWQQDSILLDQQLELLENSFCTDIQLLTTELEHILNDSPGDSMEPSWSSPPCFTYIFI